jgi:Family of unknown function (DUF5681)
MQFQPGQSGNPAGRPPGARNKRTRAVEAMLDGELEDITRKAVELARAGNLAAIRLCLDRLCPRPKGRPAPFDMPSMQTAEDAVKASAAIVDAVAVGELTPGEAAELTKVIETFAKTLQMYDLEARVRKLEADRKQRSGF